MSVELDLPSLAGWMRDAGEPVTGSLRGARVGQGQSNLTYRIDDEAGRSWIARRPPLGHLLASAHDVAREHRIISALQATGVPVPATLGAQQPFDAHPLVAAEEQRAPVSRRGREVGDRIVVARHGVQQQPLLARRPGRPAPAVHHRAPMLPSSMAGAVAG